MVPDGDVPNTDAKLEIRAAGIEDTRPHEALTSFDNQPHSAPVGIRALARAIMSTGRPTVLRFS